MKMNASLNNILSRVIPWLLVVLLSALLIYVWRKEPEVITETKENVVEKVKTITIKEPVPVNTYITRPILIPFETEKIVVQNDTTYIVLDREVKEYRDSSYYCRISGFDPQLEELQVNQKTIEHTITNTIERKPIVCVGPSLSMGYDFGTKTCNTTVGISVVIPIFTWYLK